MRLRALAQVIWYVFTKSFIQLQSRNKRIKEFSAVAFPALCRNLGLARPKDDSIRAFDDSNFPDAMWESQHGLIDRCRQAVQCLLTSQQTCYCEQRKIYQRKFNKLKINGTTSITKRTLKFLSLGNVTKCQCFCYYFILLKYSFSYILLKLIFGNIKS